MKKKIRNTLKEFRAMNFVILFIAGIINAIAVTMFLAPVHLYDSGISGTSMLLWQITPEWLTLSFFLIVLNIPLFIYGAKKTGDAVYRLFHICGRNLFVGFFFNN